MQDAFCVPYKEETGCGTTGLPPCPQDMVQKEGTLAILTAPSPGSSWEIRASLEVNLDGCLYRYALCQWQSVMRSLVAKPSLLRQWPGNHEVASVHEFRAVCA
jgi:hypothetical protein